MHIGNEIRLKMKEKGCTVTWLAGQLFYTRANIYKIFEKPSIDTDLLKRISVVLEFDFFSLYTEQLHETDEF